MAEKRMTSSSGYFNQEMLAILAKGEKKAPAKKKTASKATTKKGTKK